MQLKANTGRVNLVNSKRTTILAVVLATLASALVAKMYWESYTTAREEEKIVQENYRNHLAPLPGINSITNATVSQDDSGHWFLLFDYYWTGQPSGVVLSYVTLGGNDPLQPAALPQNSVYLPPQKGNHQMRVEIKRPLVGVDVRMTRIRLQFMKAAPPNWEEVLAVDVPTDIQWPDVDTEEVLESLRNKTPEKFLEEVSLMIDSGTKPSFEFARKHLTVFLEKYPNNHFAYSELARLTYKSNGGPEGLRQAETYLDTARQIAPQDADVWADLAYVYTLQGRYKEAQSLFIAASKVEQRSPWLWYEWGVWYLVQKKTSQAKDMFSRILEEKPASHQAQRARVAAYNQLIFIYKDENQLDQLEAMYERRYSDFKTINCYAAELAEFVVIQRGNAVRALEISSQSPDVNCKNPFMQEITGLAYYVLWANGDPGQRPSLLNRARITYPSGTRLVYRLASSDSMLKVLMDLMTTGESIDQLDNAKMTALAYAIQNKDYLTAKRLLLLHAKVDVVVGASEMPLALIPVISEDYQGIKLLRQFGADYAKIKYQGTTAIDFAKQAGNKKLLNAVEEHEQNL